MEEHLKKNFNNIVEVKTTNIVAEVDHPRVYYKINPKIGYIVCSYTNTCFKLAEDADVSSKEYFFYKGNN